MEFGFKKLGTWAFSVLSGRASAVVGLLAIQAILARWMTKQDFGAYLLIQTAVVGLGLVGMGGLNRLILRDLRTSLSSGDKDEASITLGTGLAIGLPIVLLATLMTWIIAYTAGPALGLPRDPRLAGLIAALVFLLSTHQILAETLRGLFRVKLASLFAGATGGPVQVASTLVLFAALRWLPKKELTMGIEGALTVHIVALIVALPVLLYFCSREFRSQNLTVWNMRPWQWRPMISRYAEAPGLALAQFATFATSNMDVWLAAALLPGSAVALYLAPRRLVYLTSSSLQVMNNIVAPIIPDLHAKKDLPALELILRRIALAVLVVSAIISLPMLFFPTQICTLAFSSAYQECAKPLVILTVAQLVNAFTGSCGITLMLTGHQKDVLISNALCTLGMLALVTLAGPMTLMKLAWIAAITVIVQFLTLWLLTKIRLGIWTHFAIRMPAWSTRS